MARTISVYRYYNFTDKDPVIDEMRTIAADEGLSEGQLAILSGASYTTIHGWFKGKTRRPQNPTVSAVIEGMGYHRRIVKKKGWNAGEEWERAHAAHLKEQEQRRKRANGARKRRRK